MEFKGTPAPWIIIDGDDYFNITAKSTESSPNYMPLLDSDSIGMIEMRANAHLIAAAPELLESLRELVSAMERYEIDVDESAPVEHKKMMKKAKAAITKALGQR